VSKVWIEENFFPLDIYREIVQQILSVEYVPILPEIVPDYGKAYWFTSLLPDDCDVQKQMVKLIQEKFNIIVSEWCHSLYTMIGKTAHGPRPHTDAAVGATHNCLIYMHGEESTNNGTGFYHKTGTGELELSIHVGFKHNRAIFFSSDVIHGPLTWAGNGSFRYSIANFFKGHDLSKDLKAQDAKLSVGGNEAE
jgi:hypothetical protein|tara:strand:+ start:575 stop:1156 length:582 start_codon:yes stop_codon:yes gene_type:complete